MFTGGFVAALSSVYFVTLGRSSYTPDCPVGERHPNLLGRFFRGVLRSVQPAGLKPDVP